jgi:hypothetical protein
MALQKASLKSKIIAFKTWRWTGLALFHSISNPFLGDTKEHKIHIIQIFLPFKKELMRWFNIELPLLATQFRRTRVKVLHEGINSQPEDSQSLVVFALGLMKKLEDVCSKSENQ